MPFTRKGGNKQGPNGGVSEDSKTKNGKEGIQKRQEKEAMYGEEKHDKKKKETADKKNEVTLVHKRDELAIKDERALSSKKRKPSDITVTEPPKRAKMAIPEVTSPRRSSRAVVPNSRYKDMEVMDIGKKKSSTISSTGPEKTVKKTHMAKQPGNRLIDQGFALNIVSEEVLSCDAHMDKSVQMNLTDDILVLSSNVAETKTSTKSNGDKAHTNIIYTDETRTGPIDNGLSEVTSHPIINDYPVSKNEVQDSISLKGVKKVVETTEDKPEANVIVISDKDQVKHPEQLTSKIGAPNFPNIINVPKGVTIIKKISRQNVVKQMEKTVEIKGDGFQADISQKALPLSTSDNVQSPLILKDGPVIAPALISDKLIGLHSRITEAGEISVKTCSASYEKVAPGFDQVLIENNSGNEVSNNSSTDAAKPKVNVVYVKVKPKNTAPISDPENKLTESIITSSIPSESGTDNVHSMCSLASLSETENNFPAETVEVQNENPYEINDEVHSGAIEIVGKDLLDTNMLETNEGTIEANDASESNYDPKSNGSVCEVFKMDKPTTDSPQVAIEYVVLGDRIVPIHKPFSQSNAGIYKKTSTNSKSLKKIPVKVAQTAINSLLEGKPHNTAYSIDTADIEDGTADSEQQTAVDLDNEMDAGNIQVEASTSQPDKPQQKHGRVIHGYLDKIESHPGPTQIVEISQDMFTKEVYGESAILDHVTGELVPSSDIPADIVNDNNFNEGENSFVELKPDEETNNVIVAGMVEGPKSRIVHVGDMTDVSVNIQDTGQLHTDIKDSSANPVQPFDIENMMEGDSVVLRIDDNGIILNETPAYRSLTNVKINPAAPADSTNQSESLVYEENVETEYTAVPTIQIKPVTAVQSFQKETETQTDVQEEEEESNVDYSEDTVETIDAGSTNKSVIVVKKEEDSIRRTTVRMEENGVIQEYVVVHLPEGAEIKQQEVKQSVQDPVHNEPITQTKDGLYYCVDCDHTTDRRGNWYKHRRKHLGIRPHSCPKCDYKAATSSNLKRHMQIHYDVRNFECTECGLFFRQKIHLERHIKYKHQEKKVKCPLCDYMCSSENPDLKIHIRRRHMPQEDGSMSAFTCNECGLMTVSKKDLKQHMKFHRRGPELKLFCEFCSFVTDCESRLRRHMLIHTKEKPFQCGLCSYRATQKEHVLRHMKTQHDVEVERKTRKSLLTPEPKSKPRRSLLDGNAQPLITVTEPTEANKLFEKSDYSCTDKIFACNHCSMKFSKLINLYKHLFAQHKQVMPDTSNNFQCVVCDFRTNNKKNLLVHMRKHNMQDHAPPTHVYSCVLCRYINPRRRNLFQHMKKKHNIQIMMKDDGSECFVGGDVIVEQADGKQGIMALSEIVATHPLVDDSQLQIITEDGTSFQAEKISLDNLMSVEDISAYETISSQESINSNVATIPGTPFQQSNIAGHEAAEAIEGLQALAEQAAGVVETHPIDADISTEIITSEIMTDGEIMTVGEETSIEENMNNDDGIELSSEQLNQLSAGDYVEINGEVYKVEISQENTQK